MRIELPAGESKINIPSEWSQWVSATGLVHHKLWSQSSQLGDICLGSDLAPNEVIDFVLGQSPKTIVQYNSAWFKNDVEMAIKMAQSQAGYFSDPVGTVMNTPAMEWAFTDGTQKQSILDQVYAALPNASQILKESVRAVFEELYMNAILDAPRESLRSGSEKYGYEKMTPAKISLGFDSSRLALACTDPYGTLDIARFLNRMNEVYKRGAGQVVNLVREKGGAGLGCVILFEHSSALFLGVRAGKSTTVTCQIPLNLNHRQRAMVPKSLHILEK